MTDSAVKAYLSSIGRKGGKATGATKVRGDSDYYKEIAAKAVKARKAKAKKKSAKKKPAQKKD